MNDNVLTGTAVIGGFFTPLRGNGVLLPVAMPDALANDSVFNDYDIVVAITQKTINQQLAALVQAGAVPAQLTMTKAVDAQGQYTYQVLPPSSPVPRDAQGAPTVSCIDGTTLPQINISASGTSITFVLHFTAGTAWLWDGAVGPLAQLTAHDMTGWRYGVNMNLDLSAVAQASGSHIPPLVQQQLTEFTNNMFEVSQLALDFTSANLATFDPAFTNATGTDKGTAQLVEFLQFYLPHLVKDGNPYILGYSLTTTGQTQVPADQNVPDSLRPTGTTFSVYHDPGDPDRSTLNFVLATAGGHGHVSGSPANFTANWLDPSEACDAKVIYSHACLAEPLLLRPLFDRLRQDVYAQIGGRVSVPEGNDYDAAKQANGSGWDFHISQINQGDDQYQNNFSVQVSTQPGAAVFSFAGTVDLYKEVSKDCFFCTAHAHASGHIGWSGSLTLTAGRDAAGRATLEVANHFQTDTNSSDHDQNSCADAFEWIGKVLGGIIDVFTGWADNGFFSNLFADAFSVSAPGIGSLSLVLQNLSGSTRNLIMLPAGQVFTFQNPAVDALGNVSLQLTYQA